MTRRNVQLFNLSLLDLLTSALGAVIFLFIITPKGGAPPTLRSQIGIYIDTIQNQVFGPIHGQINNNIGDTIYAVLVDYQSKEKEKKGSKPAPEKQAAPPRVMTEEVPKPTPAPEKEVKKEIEPVTPKINSYKGDAPSVPCKVSFEIFWASKENNIDLFVCKDGRCVYGSRKKDRSIGDWDSGKSRNRIFGNDLRTNQEAVRQFDEIIAGDYEIYALFKDSQKNETSVTINGLIYTKNDDDQEQGQAFSQRLDLTKDRMLIGKVILQKNGTFTFTKK